MSDTPKRKSEVTKQPPLRVQTRVLVAVAVLQCSGLQWGASPTNTIPKCPLEGFTVDTKHPKRYTPTEAASVIGISPNSLRNWCASFKDHLSEGATPAPGNDRILTDRDIGILQRVKELRAEHRGYDYIKTELATMPVETELAPYIDLQPVPTPQDSVQQSPTALQPTDILQALQIVVDSRYNQLQGQIDAMGSVQADRLRWFVFGIAVGVLLVVAAVFVVWLGMAAR